MYTCMQLGRHALIWNCYPIGTVGGSCHLCLLLHVGLSIGIVVLGIGIVVSLLLLLIVLAQLRSVRVRLAPKTSMYPKQSHLQYLS